VRADHQSETSKTEKIPKKVRILNDAKPPLAMKAEPQQLGQDLSEQPVGPDKDQAKQQLFALLMDNQKKI
jgi:hypothetical protein